MFGRISFKTLLVSGTLALVAGGAGAATVNFERITENSPSDSAGQLVLNVTDDGARALFAFTVGSDSPSPDASIAEIYFSDLNGIFALPLSLEDQSGVSFGVGSATPPNLPGANLATPDFVVTSGLLANSGNANSNAIQFGDLLVLAMNYAAGGSFSSLLDALDSGAFRVGLHVRSLVGTKDDTTTSDSFVSTPPASVPVPAAGLLLVGALGGLAALRRRRHSA